MKHQYIPWHEGAVIYQIYPRSFYDAKGTGIGNLQGIIDKLDYLGGNKDSLGVNAIWISPIYTSPMADFGYDVVDYTNIDPIFGNINDFKLLVREAHKRSIKVVLDFVPNHSSDEHPWFVQSQSSIDNPKRDWYVWRSPKHDGSVPNNWLSAFGGSAWQLSEKTQQYYLHSFLAKQPDLNWDNPAVREAMKTAMRFWLDLGVDGFRVDAADWLSKDPQFRDDPVSQQLSQEVGGSEQVAIKHVHSRGGPHLFDRLNEMTQVLKKYPDRFMIAEAHPETDNKIQGYLQYYKAVNSQLSAPLNFEGIYLPWKASAFRTFIDAFQAGMQPSYTPIYTMGNHDESRVASRIGRRAARTAAMMLLTLPGLPFIYYGDELGMTDVAISKEQLRDPFTKPGKGRDGQRTPMQWDTTAHAGFTEGTPWLPVASDYHLVNVSTQSQDPQSSFNLFKQLIHFRNCSSILKSGTYRSVDYGKDILGYERAQGTNKLLILLNFTSTEKQINLGRLQGQLQLSSYLDGENSVMSKRILLRPNEGLIIGVSDD